MKSLHYHPRRKRRRFLVIPQSERELSEIEEAYCGGNEQEHQEAETETEIESWSRNKRRDNFWIDNMIANCGIESSSQQSRCRPLPSTQALLSNPNMNITTTTKKQPISDNKSTSSIHSSSLLRKFYKSIGIKDPSSKDGTTNTTKSNNEDDDNNGEKSTRRRQVIDEIDDSFLATLKIGHHNRYLKLTTDSQQQQQTSRRTFAQRKEFKILRQLVTKEQTAYRLSLDKFHELHKLRYMIGFGSSSDSMDEKTTTTSSNRANNFCRWACAYSQSINQEWKNNMLAAMIDDSNTSNNNSKPNNINHALPKRYGKVRQTLGLHCQARRQSSLDVQDLTCSIVHESLPISKPHPSSSSSSSSSTSTSISAFSMNDKNKSSHERIPPPTIELAPSIDLLRNDKKALELASRYSATIVTTSESLETLLQLPGEYSAKWMLFCTKRTVGVLKKSISVTILDIPLAQAFSSPRACLESGLQEGLYQLFQQKQQQEQEQELCDNNTTAKDNEKKDNKSFIPSVTQAVYSLWTLPGKNTAGSSNNATRKPTRVLIRTLVRLKDSASKLPVRLRAHVEYFSSSSIIRNNNGDEDHDLVSRGGRKEIPSSYETSLWILDQVLFGHKVSCLQYRIDPTTCTILGWDPTSIAHAFAVSGSDRDSNKSSSSTYSGRHGPLDHWESLIQLLQSIPSIDVSDCLLCLPGRVVKTNAVTVTEIDKGASLREEITTAIDYDSDPEIHQQQQQQQIRVDPFSVSVHAPCEESYGRIIRKPQQAAPNSQLPSQRFGPATATIDLEDNVLDQAGAVILGEQALRDCRRDWEWNRPGQIPNTFPVTDKA
jgi:hypothetical protein